MSFLNGVLTALALLAQPEPPAPPPPPPGSEDEVAEVVVTAPSRTAIRKFVDELSKPPAGLDQLGRWDRRICPGVIGLSPANAQYLLDRVANTALKVGLRVGEPGCRANVLVIVTKNGEAQARELAENAPELFDARNESGNTPGRSGLRAFVETPRPVRWWHVASTVTDDGFGGNGENKTVLVRDASRLRSNVRQDFNRAILIVDLQQIGAVRFDALADYISMVTLAQIDPQADPSGLPTILGLFADQAAGRTPPAGLTEWDETYLKGLYTARRNARNSRAQQAQISRTMRQGSRSRR